jgi:hypothetical protein
MPVRRALLVLLSALGLLFVAAAIIGWAVRLRVATRLVDRRLAATGVPSFYRLTRLGPNGARLEDVRLGDPAAPDLSAERLDVRFGYGMHGPYVAGLSAAGVRLGGRWDAHGLSLGSLDRLLPRGSGGGAVLPDLPLDLADVALRLATPAGLVSAALDGRGNPQRRFSGRLRIAADRLHLGDCSFTGVDATLRISVVGGSPTVTGPVSLGGSRCPSFRLAPGQIDIRLATDPSVQRLSATITPKELHGQAGPVRFSGLSGLVRASGPFDALDASARLQLRRGSAPEWSRRAAMAARPLAGTPVGPVAAKAGAATARLLAGASADATLALSLRSREPVVALRRLRLSDEAGAWAEVAAIDGLGWSNGWRTDADLRTGGTLPALHVTVRQDRPGAPLTGLATLAPYAAGAARLAVLPTRFRWQDGRLRFAGNVRLDGPLPDGFVRELAIPVDGLIATDGSVRLDAGCRRASLDALTVGSARLERTALTLCGSPLISRSAALGLRIDARTGPVRLAGRLGSGAAVVTADAFRLTERGFAAEGVSASLGDAAAPTRLQAGQIGGDWSGGTFSGMAGTIGSVPLRLSGGEGRWARSGATLRLTGTLAVADTAPTPRFLPLAAKDASLTLADGRITADARLVEPKSGALIAQVALRHDLPSGAGEADLTVDALRFRPSGLQPEALTPLTLGVIANVAGTVSGGGVIRWTAAGVTSQGAFGTDRLDLAAAFGPVTGIAGRIRFTDLLGLISAPDQEVRVAEINPGVAIADGRVRFHLPGNNQVAVDEAAWPFAGGTLRLEPTVIDLSEGRERRLTFTLAGLDAARFVQQLDFPNLAATGTFDGTLPMRFDTEGGRIVEGAITARVPGGTLAYVGELSSARLGTFGKLAFDALKAIRYSALDIRLDGRLDGEMVSRVSFTGVRQATPEQGLAARLIHNLPFRFNIRVQAPFRGLVGSVRSYADPRLLLTAPAAVQPAASAGVP